MDRASAEKYHLIAQQRAAQFKTVRQESHLTRARSQDGQPVPYRKVKEKANISRRSRVMSDPEIPSTLVILNAKGLFQGKNGNYTNTQSRPESSAACVNTMDTDINRPQFFDPSLRSKEAKVSDLRKKFEAVDCDIAGEKHGVTGSDFLNPLHKINQDFTSSNNTAKGTVKKKLEEAPSSNNSPIPQSPSALKTHKLQSDSMPAKESEAKVEMPTRPPPRALPRDPLKRLRSETDPMPLDENRLSRVHAFPQESVKEVVREEENSPQQSSETENVSEVTNCNGADDDDNYDDVDDDFDTDEWDSDFDDDEEEEDDEQQKRDSQSSHGSSCDAEPLVSFCLTLNLLKLNIQQST